MILHVAMFYLILSTFDNKMKVDVDRCATKARTMFPPWSMLVESHMLVVCICVWMLLWGDKQTRITHSSSLLCVPFQFPAHFAACPPVMLFVHIPSRLHLLCPSLVIGTSFLKPTLLFIHTFLLGSEFGKTNENIHFFLQQDNNKLLLLANPGRQSSVPSLKLFSI